MRIGVCLLLFNRGWSGCSSHCEFGFFYQIAVAGRADLAEKASQR